MGGKIDFGASFGLGIDRRLRRQEAVHLAMLHLRQPIGQVVEIDAANRPIESRGAALIGVLGDSGRESLVTVA